MKLLSFAFFTFYLANIGFSQTTYSSGNYINGGDSYAMSQVNSGLGALDFTITGANQNWDYSTIVMQSQSQESALTASATGYQFPFVGACVLLGGNVFSCGAEWSNNADFGVQQLDTLNLFIVELTNVMSIYKKTSQSLVTTIFGAKIKDTGNTTIPLAIGYEIPDTVYQFPLTYGSGFSGDSKFALDLSPAGLNYSIVTRTTRTYQVDGWGELITPYTTFNSTLRVKTIINRVDSLYGLPIPLGLPTTQVVYEWFDPAYGLPVMKATGTILGPVETINSVTYIDQMAVGINQLDLDNSVSIYPNPSSGFITVKLNEQWNAEVSYQLFDISGKQIEIMMYENRINISDLSKGVYSLQISDQNKSISKRIIKL